MNNFIQMPERVIIEETENPNICRFILQPLEKGYGVTIGNSLRRVLLSSIPGNAIIGVKIKGVLHEFQVIPGVVEDVTEIILNLKQLRFKVNDKNLRQINFTISGPKDWTGRDIQEASSAIEIINLDHHIATISENIDLDVQLRIGKGKGYVPAEEQPTADFPIEMLPMDAVFTPILNVVYTIEPFRVGQRTDYERLVLEVKTDGTISPVEAVNYSAKILDDHIRYFISFEEEVEEEIEEAEAPVDEIKESEKSKLKKILITPIEDLELSVRANNCLKAAGIKTLGELISYQESELLKFRNFGRKSLEELREVIRQFGLEFGMNVEKFLKDEVTKGV